MHRVLRRRFMQCECLLENYNEWIATKVAQDTTRHFLFINQAHATSLNLKDE